MVSLKRRWLLSAGLLLLPRIAASQPARKPARIVFLGPGSGDAALSMLREGMRKLGYVEGRDIVTEIRDAQGDAKLLARYANEIVGSSVDIIVTVGAGIGVVQKLTRTIPVVARSSIDPVEAGYAQSLAHPGGNITGVTSFAAELNPKRLELIKDALPNVTRVGVIWQSTSTGNAVSYRELKRAAGVLGLEVISLPLDSAKEIGSAFRRGADEKVQALVTLRSSATQVDRDAIVQLAQKYRIPVIYDDSVQVDKGGLFSYGAHLDDLHRRLAVFVDKILKGEKPGDLPFEQPTKFELVVNLRTAKALGIKLPDTILVRADKLIE